jgi:hypothetical protein
VAAQVLLRATFTGGSANESPALICEDVNLVGYLNNTSATYVTTEIGLTQGIASTKLYAQMSVPANTTAAWYASNDGGATWELMAQQSSRPIDPDWTEYVFSRTFTNPAGTRIQYKAEMAGTALLYPRIHSIGATLS